MFKQIAKWKQLTIYAWYVGDEHIHLHIGILPNTPSLTLFKS